MKIKNRLAEFRSMHGLSQEELAKKTGVSRPYISEIETGAQTVITNVIMLKLATALDESVSDIFFSNDVIHKQHSKEAI